MQSFQDVASTISSNFDALRKILQNNISLGDNIYCDVVTGSFDSGVPRACQLTHLSSAKGCIVLGSAVPCIASPLVSMNGISQATVTLFFAGMVKNVQATVVLFDLGFVGSPYGTLFATTKVPGIVQPDGTTVTVSPAGVISATSSISVGGVYTPIETPTGPTTTTNTNDTYTCAHTILGTPQVFVGGEAGLVLMNTDGTVFSVSGNMIIFTPTYIPNGQKVVVSYAH